MRKLDGELEKFRLELEADNSGVTSKIEHRMCFINFNDIATRCKNASWAQYANKQSFG